jgi:AcrR family transcriptional regulator
MDAAERLFGEQGFARVSLREITREAGANVAAVNYHFGSRDRLVDAVFARRLAPLNVERMRLLDLAQDAAGDAPPTLEAILRCFIGPTFRFSRRHPEFMRLMSRLHIESSNFVQSFLETGRFPELIAKMREMLVRVLPDCAVSDLWWGMSFVVGAMIHTWAKGREIEMISQGEAEYGSDEETIDRLVRFAAAGLRAASGAPAGGER